MIWGAELLSSFGHFTCPLQTGSCGFFWIDLVVDDCDQLKTMGNWIDNLSKAKKNSVGPIGSLFSNLRKPQGSGSRQGMILLPREHLAMSGGIFGCLTGI